jgi:hypothetical protein
MRIGAVGVAYVEVRRYRNELTGVDPGNFPIALAALTTLFTVPMWLAISPLIVMMITVGYVIRYYWARITTRRGRYRTSSIYWQQELDLAQIGRHGGPLKYLTDRWYKVRNFQSIRSFWGLDFAEDQNLFTQKLRAAGATCLFISLVVLFLFMDAPWSQPIIRFIATNVLVATEFSYDRTCAVSSEGRLVAVLKYRREMRTSIVSIADVPRQPEFSPHGHDIRFPTGTCDQDVQPSAPESVNLTDP